MRLLEVCFCNAPMGTRTADNDRVINRFRLPLKGREAVRAFPAWRLITPANESPAINDRVLDLVRLPTNDRAAVSDLVVNRASEPPGVNAAVRPLSVDREIKPEVLSAAVRFFPACFENEPEKA